MSEFFLLCYEFFKTGLFSVGGGLATLPFLYRIAEKYDWLSAEIIPDMVAVAESTPGPIGINMATYAGYNAFGIPGGVAATIAMVLPSFFIVLAVSRFLSQFRESLAVKRTFYGLRPAVAGLIAAAGWEIFRISVLSVERFSLTGSLLDLVQLKAAALFVLIYVLVVKFNRHPVVYIAGAAAAGILFRF